MCLLKQFLNIIKNKIMKSDLFVETIFIIDITLFVVFCIMFITILSLVVKDKLNLN